MMTLIILYANSGSCSAVTRPLALKPGMALLSPTLCPFSVARVERMELLPELPGFDESADPDDVRAYRLFPEIRLDRLRERAEWLRDEIRNRARMEELRAEVDAYRRRVLAPAAIVRHLAETVARAAGKGNGA